MAISLGYVSLLLLLFGVGTLLEYSSYHPISFFLVYLTLLGLPFIWVLPNRIIDHSRLEIALLIGVGGIAFLGVAHLGIAFGKGSRNESLLILIPSIGLVQSHLALSFLFPR